MVAGVSPEMLFGCSHPCQGAGWPRQHALLRSVHSSWCCLHSPCLGRPRCCFQESALPMPSNTGAAGADGAPKATACTPKAIPCTPKATACSPLPVPGNVLAVALHPTRPIAYQCPALPSPPRRQGWGWWCLPCQALQLCLWSCQLDSHHSSLEGFPGDGCVLPVGWGRMSGQSHFWLHLHLWEMVFLVPVAVLNHTKVHPLPHTPCLGRLQEALEVEKALQRASRGEYGPGW